MSLDAARADQQRRDDLFRDLAAVTLAVGEDTLAPQLALNEFAADMGTILAAINGRAEHFAEGYERLRELFPDARALHVATSPEYDVTTVGAEPLLGPFRDAEHSGFCAEGRAYTVVASGIGSRGWVALALDPERTLARARAAAGQPVTLALLEVGRADLLTDGRGSVCVRPEEPVYATAATGEYGTALVERGGALVGIGYSAVLGTRLSVVIEDDAAHREALARSRRAATATFFAFAWAVGLLAWTTRSRWLGGPEA